MLVLEIPEAGRDVVDHGKFMLMGRPTHHTPAMEEKLWLIVLKFVLFSE